MTNATKDLSLQQPPFIHEPTKEYDAAHRLWQGIPGIEKTDGGRLYVTFYSGGTDEGPDNYVILIKSDDDGSTWSKPLVVVDPIDQVRAFDPVLWHDPERQLWLFWAQSYTKFDGRCGVWSSVCANPDGEHPTWSQPRRLGHGIMMNKPTVLSDGNWLLPTAIWADHVKQTDLNTLPQEQFSNVYRSADQGKTFHLWGGADVENRWFDEHMVVERTDGSLWMLVRTQDGIGQSVSTDGGKTWSTGSDTGWGGPNSRFFIRRLQSGNLLLVNHTNSSSRSHLAALLSCDDGKTWPYQLMLDERQQVSYPDGIQDKDGWIYVVYDCDRRHRGEILLAKFREEDIRHSGNTLHAQSKLRLLVSKLR